MSKKSGNIKIILLSTKRCRSYIVFALTSLLKLPYCTRLSQILHSAAAARLTLLWPDGGGDIAAMALGCCVASVGLFSRPASAFMKATREADEEQKWAFLKNGGLFATIKKEENTHCVRPLLTLRGLGLHTVTIS